jgi:hypothetical protein
MMRISDKGRGGGGGCTGTDKERVAHESHKKV